MPTAFHIGDLVAGSVTVAQLPRGEGKVVIYSENNSGLAIQFASRGALLYRKLKAEGTAREIPTNGSEPISRRCTRRASVAVRWMRFLQIAALG